MKAALIILVILVVALLIVRFFATKEYVRVFGEKPKHGKLGPSAIRSTLFVKKESYENGVYTFVYENRSSLYLKPLTIESVSFNEKMLEDTSFIKFDKVKVPIGEEVTLTINSGKEYEEMDYFVLRLHFGKGNNQYTMDQLVTIKEVFDKMHPELATKEEAGDDVREPRKKRKLFR